MTVHTLSSSTSCRQPKRLGACRAAARVQAVQGNELGYFHVDVEYLPQMADEDRRRYLHNMERAAPRQTIGTSRDKFLIHK